MYSGLPMKKERRMRLLSILLLLDAITACLIAHIHAAPAFELTAKQYIFHYLLLIITYNTHKACLQ